MHPTHSDVLAEQGVDNPERRTQQGDILNENTVAIVDVNELRAQTVLGSETAFLHVHSILSILQQTCSGTHVLPHLSCFPTVCVLATPFPPCGILATSVDCTLTGDGYVILLVGIDAWLEVVAVETFPACRHDRIELGLEHKLQHGSLLNVKVYLTHKCNGTSVECSFRNNHSSATRL